MKKQVFLLFAALLFSQAAFAYDFSAVAPSGQTLYYTISSGGYDVYVVYPNTLSSWGDHDYWGDYSKPTGNLIIPDSVTHGGTSYCVTSIGGSAFYGCTGLTSVTIPNSVTRISYHAFYGCTGLTSVTIPNSVIHAGGDAFEACSNIIAPIYNNTHFVYMPTSYSGSYSIPNGITTICPNAFYQCTGLISVTIPNTVTYIGSEAFRNCTGLISVAIPNSVTSIQVQAFLSCTGLTSVIIPNSVTDIGGGAFRNCTGLTSVTIPNSVTSIENGVFHGCTGLTSVTIPNSVTSIGNNAFSGCIGLTSVTIPDSVTYIGEKAFYGCAGLTSVTIPNSVTSFQDGLFRNCTGLTSITIGNSVTKIRAGAFHGCTGLTSITIPNSISYICDGAFYGCTGLTSVVFNANNCYRYEGFNDDDQHYYREIFENCPNITSFSFGNNVKLIPALLCAEISGLTSVTIPDSVTSIGEAAFYGCTGLTSVTIGNSVTSINEYAFFGCTGLTSVNYTGTVDQWCSINIESNPIAYSHNLYINNVLLTDLVFSDRITNINDNFSGDAALNTITIPNTVTRIYDGAFNGCTGLTSVVFNAVNCTWASYSSNHSAFGGCPNITSFTFGNNVEEIPSYLCYGMMGLTSMKFLGQMPPQIGTYALTGIPTNIPVYIPCGRLAYYVAQMPQFSNFVEQQVGFSALSDDESMGTVQVLTEPSCSNHNAVLYAVPADGYRFDHWSTGSTDNPYTLTVTTDTTVIGYFVSTGGTEGIGEIDEDNIRISVLDGHICVEGITNEELRVYDITGRMVQNRSLLSGVYIVKIGTLPAQKVVVMR